MTNSVNKRLRTDHRGSFLKSQHSGTGKQTLKNENYEELLQQHMSWTAKQGLILTGGGKAEELYTNERGYPFAKEECPHYHLLKGQTHQVFQTWKRSAPKASLVTGVWNRTIFVGGWHNTTDKDEIVYNIQTHNLFVDLRIPRSRDFLLSKSSSARCLQDLGPLELKLYARQHVFAGFSMFGRNGEGRPLCTRHHCVDWNFVGRPRNRPNKWFIEINPGNPNLWKEHSYAKDDHGQHYYWEQWERIPCKRSDISRLALRKSCTERRDGILVAIGDHFNYVLTRTLNGNVKDYPEAESLVEIVDAAVSAGDLETARSYLSTQGGHGRISNGRWRIDIAISPWEEGKQLWNYNKEVDIQLVGDSIDSCHILWKGERWDLYDCSFHSVQDLKCYLGVIDDDFYKRTSLSKL